MTETEQELVLYLKLVLLEFGHEAISHDDMLGFDKRFTGQTPDQMLVAGSIPDLAWCEKYIDFNDGSVRPWFITEKGYSLLNGVKYVQRKRKRNREQSSG